MTGGVNSYCGGGKLALNWRAAGPLEMLAEAAPFFYLSNLPFCIFSILDSEHCNTTPVTTKSFYLQKF